MFRLASRAAAIGMQVRVGLFSRESIVEGAWSNIPEGKDDNQLPSRYSHSSAASGSKMPAGSHGNLMLIRNRVLWGFAASKTTASE